jgi:hypothetical protein
METLVFLGVLLILILIAYLRMEPFIRAVINIQNIYHFSFAGHSLLSSQKVLSFLNSFNFSFLNTSLYFLPESYFEQTRGIIYFIINTDYNLIRNAGGCIALFLILLILSPIWMIYQIKKNSKAPSECWETILILWSFFQSNITYFSLLGLIKLGNYSTD